MAKKEKLPPIHPGEILREDFMAPLRLSANHLAIELRVPVTRISDLVRERRAITPDTALRLGRFFNTSPRFWLNLQAAFDLECAEDEVLEKIERDVHPMAAAARSARR
jgi:addiction module HigA family antidote